jgi:hypothetical protein
MEYQNYFYCPCCCAQSVIERNNTQGICLGCDTRYIHHKCRGNGLAGIPQDLWLQAATAVSSHACPFCGQVARVAQAVSKLPGLSEEAKSFFGTIAVGALVVGLLVFLDGVFSPARRRT